jgi:hypothetical protein
MIALPHELMNRIRLFQGQPLESCAKLTQSLMVLSAEMVVLIGHAGTAMLHKHYAHLGAKAQALRSALEQVRG